MTTYRIGLALMLIVTAVLGFGPSASAQGSQPSFKGSLAIGGFHFTDSGTSSLPSFGASISGNAVFAYKDFYLPFGVSINNQGTSFQNPFNRYGISPTYRSVKLHLGWRRMRFSKYTMRGLQFFGAGLELTPGVFHFSAMTGRVDYRIAGAPTELIDALPERRIMAAKLGVGSRKNLFHLTFMKGQDEADAVDSLTKPKENAAIGAELKLSLFKNKITFNVDGGLSVFTENRNSGNDFLKNVSIPRFAESLLKPNNSTHINYAVEAEMGFHLKNFTLKNTFRRIMPEYQSLGLNYLRNDVQSFVVAPAINAFKNKLLLSGSVGFERNNLDDLRNIDQERIISSVNVNIRPNTSHNFYLLYANYSFDQTVQFDSLVTNSIVIKQVNKTFGGNYTHTSTNASNSKVLSIALNVQNADNLGQEIISNNTLAVMINYSLMRMSSNSSINFGINYFDVSFMETKVRQAGLNLGYTKRSGKNHFNIQGGSMINAENKDLNSHLSVRYKLQIQKRLGLEISSRGRYNQHADRDNRFILRSDIRLRLQF